MSYAARTRVGQDRSEAEIKRIVLRFGAEQFMSAQSAHRAVLGFKVRDRLIRFELPLPTVEDVRKTETGRDRNAGALQDAHDQETRRRWRALALVIKAKLEAVETGVTTFEQEFLAHIVMPGGKTVAELTLPSINAAYASGKVRPLLPEFT